ncbi:hypothetical protein CCACVL1_15637 [Corchorus capsularis]|uniref:Uncharacterized protein n=1 Tax=Corchorus capsularis TaxID=210143 RepID=A0A1R3I1J6_COCAP|nr:hypothetical protein CCACVL1_15637 [Corchorus capsularis]
MDFKIFFQTSPTQFDATSTATAPEEKSKKKFNEKHPDKSYSADVFKDFATKWECMTNAEVEMQMRKLDNARKSNDRD